MPCTDSVPSFCCNIALNTGDRAISTARLPYNRSEPSAPGIRNPCRNGAYGVCVSLIHIHTHKRAYSPACAHVHLHLPIRAPMPPRTHTRHVTSCSHACAYPRTHTSPMPLATMMRGGRTSAAPLIGCSCTAGIGTMTILVLVGATKKSWELASHSSGRCCMFTPVNVLLFFSASQTVCTPLERVYPEGSTELGFKKAK